LQPRPPRSADRTRSPAAVSQKREYFKYAPETIGDFSLELPKFGVWRPTANSQKPAIGGHFWYYWGQNLLASDWLADLGGFELRYSQFANALWNIGRFSNDFMEIRAWRLSELSFQHTGTREALVSAVWFIVMESRRTPRSPTPWMDT